MRNKALYYGKLACDTMMRKFQAPELPPAGGFHYHAGVFLSGMLHIYEVCGEEKYYEYVKEWVDSFIPEPYILKGFQKGALDGYMAGILLFPLMERTGDAKYESVLKLLMWNLRNWQKCDNGGFWHSEFSYGQMWLDGLYMAGPLQAMYGKNYEQKYFLDEAVKQAVLMYENIRDEETGLLYHAWDSLRIMPWADKETGLAPEFWGRALGWYVVAVLDIMEHLDPNQPEYQKLAAIESEVLEALFKYQDPEKNVWYQIVNKGYKEDNWPESSCSCLYVYAAAKAVRMGVMDSRLLTKVLKGFQGVLKEFVEIKDGKLCVNYICVGTSVNTYEYYIERPTGINDLHGMGAFLLMCAEIAKI